MKDKTKKALIGAGIATVATVAAAGAAATAVTKYFMKVALDREGPKSVKKAIDNVSGTAFSGDAFERINNAAAKLEEMPTQTVEITSYDGEKLVGHLLEHNKSKRIIIAMHGWRSCWSRDFGIITPFWQENDCTILFAEQRGQGQSGGEYMGFGLTERFDCFEWIKWAISNVSDTLPIYLVGISMGASTVLMTAGLDLPKNVHGIMADCGFTSPHDIFKHVSENNLHLSYGIIGRLAGDICKKKIQVGTKDYSTQEAMQCCKVPVLFVHGTDDTFVPIWMTYENYKACAAEKKLFVVPGAQHGMSYLVDTDGYQAVSKEFWQKFD